MPNRFLRTARHPFLQTTRHPLEGAVDLRKRRRWFDDKGQGGDPPEQTPGTGSDKDGQGGTSGQDLESLPAWAQEQFQALQKQLKTVNDESAGRRHELDQVRQQLQGLTDAQKKQLEADGKFKELAEQRAAEIAELQGYKERAATLDTMFRESNKKRVEQVPETMRGLVPTEYSPEQLAGWLDANSARLTQRPAPEMDAGAGAGGGKKLPKLSSFEKQVADASGMTETEYAEFKVKGQPTTLDKLQE